MISCMQGRPGSRAKYLIFSEESPGSTG